jgi:competence protein ComEA
MISRRPGLSVCPFFARLLAVRSPAAFFFAAISFATAAAAQDPLPEAPAKKTVLTVCGACHEIATAIGARRAKAGWNAVIDAMANRGARATDAEFDAIVDYLSKYFGLVNVNQATAKEIEESAGLSASTAEAIVRYRMESGNFADLASLKKVPGIDTALIEERKDRFTYK